MAQYRKKSVVIEAVLNQDNPSDVAEFLGYDRDSRDRFKDGVWLIITLGGAITAQPGDWIIKGVAGEFYPCKPDIFDLTYEAVRTGRGTGVKVGADGRALK